MTASMGDTSEAFLRGGGDAGALIRSIDWSQNALGPVSAWPSTLRTTVGVMLSSSFAMRVLWGKDLIFLHNDAYRPVLGATKYPGAMGRRCADSFAELWDVVGPMFDRVMAGETVALDDRILPLDRNGYLEECFFTLSYSPLSDDRGGIGGVLGIVYETTGRLLGERRIRALRELAAAVSGIRTVGEICEAAAQTFARAAEDVPFALLYLHDAQTGTARLVARTGLDDHPAARPAVVELASKASWPFLADDPAARLWTVEDVGKRFGELHGGPYPEAIQHAIVLALRAPDTDAPYGYLVAGVSPRRALDAEYTGFYDLAGEHIVAAMTNAVAIAAVLSERQRLRSFLLEAPAAIAVLHGPQLVFDLANERYGKLVTRPIDSLIGKPVREALPDLDTQGIWNVVGNVYATGEPFAAREFAAALDGRDGYFDWIAQPTHDPHGAVDGVMIFAVDVTDQVLARQSLQTDLAERKRVELALRDSEERGRAIVAALEEGIVVRNAQGIITLANASAEAMLGIGTRGLSQLRPDERPWRTTREDGTTIEPGQSPAQQVLRDGRPRSSEVLGVERANDDVVWISVNTQPLFDAQGAISGVVSSFFDITERKSVEEERKRLLARAESALANAESASRAKDEFLAIVSHELRNPLNAMLGWTRLLRAGSLPQERAARALETIERNATNQAQLIEDLLDVSRVISGKLPLDVQTVQFARVIEAAIDSARPAIDAKGLQLRVVLDTEGVLSGDPARLQQIVWNLLTNATKFTPRGGSIRIVLRRDESHLELSVTDTGQGISASFLEHVFDRFKQADPSTTRQHGGLGLGLSIAKNLVEMHGGTIEARSEGLGHGATFIVRVPLAAMRRSPIPAAPVRTEVPAFGTEESTELRGLHVLVVDDEVDARELVTEVLAGCGATVVSAGSVKAAKTAIEKGVPDVLISDIGMPDEDGYSLISFVRARSREQGGSMPAACLTGYTTVDDRRRALGAGFNMHLSKPIEPAELVSVVASLGRMAKALRGGP